jgi:23S rRNA (guanosine2251-2'-O)-methyltransferase
VVYVLGNETQGVSRAVRALSDVALSIPMRNGVESLNVAITASLIAFAQPLTPAGQAGTAT